MATCEESRIGRSAKKKDGNREYVIKGCTTEASALALLLATAPSALGSKTLKTSECEVEEITTDIYIGKASYGLADDSQPEPGSFSISFDISGQNTRLTQSIQTISHYEDPAYRHRNFRGGINVNSDGTVDGVDILIPYMTFQVTYAADPADVTQSYIRALAGIVGKTNNAAWQGFSECELLLTKVSGSKRDEDAWDITFGFAFSENKTGLTVGDITGISKKGWEYLWCYYQTVEDVSLKLVIKRATNAYVEKVYESANYTELGIPA